MIVARLVSVVIRVIRNGAVDWKNMTSMWNGHEAAESSPDHSVPKQVKSFIKKTEKCTNFLFLKKKERKGGCLKAVTTNLKLIV